MPELAAEPYLALKLVRERGTNLAAWPTAKHFTSPLGLAPHNKISGGEVLSSKTRRTGPRRCCASPLARWGEPTPRWACSTAGYRRGWAKRRQSPPPRARSRLSSKHASARHGLRHPGATYYEDRYRQRVLNNLQRRAKSLGLVLGESGLDAARADVS